MTAPALFPDIEAVLVPWINAQLPAVFGVTARVLTETPQDLADVLPVVAVARSTGADIQGLLDRPVADVDCYTPDRISASLLSRQVHTLFHRYLPGSVAGGAVVGLVSTIKGPGWLQYQDLNVRRYNATYEIYMHPVPA